MKIPEIILIFVGVLLNDICGFTQIKTNDVKRLQVGVLKIFAPNQYRGMNGKKWKRYK